MTLRPLQDRVLIRPVERDAKSKGGIIIPDTVQEKPMEGDVLAVGPGIRDDKGNVHRPDVKAGDRILFGKWSGSEIRLDGEDLMIMKETDILGVVVLRRARPSPTASLIRRPHHDQLRNGFVHARMEDIPHRSERSIAAQKDKQRE